MSKDGEALMGEMERQALGYTNGQAERPSLIERRNNARLRVDAWVEAQELMGVKPRRQDAPSWMEYEAAEIELAAGVGGAT